MAVYVNQSYLTITIDTGIDISTASAQYINFMRPDGTKGQWDASISGTTVLSYDVQDGDLNKSGVWRLQGEFVIGGRTGFTDPVDLVVKKELE